MPVIGCGMSLVEKSGIHTIRNKKKAEQRILEVLDDGTERSYDYLRYKTMLSPQVLEEALLTLEKRKRIKHNRKELYLRRYYIVR